MIRSLFRCSGARSCLLNPARPSVSFNQFALESRLQQIQKSSEIFACRCYSANGLPPSSGVRRNLERFQLVRSQEKIERQQKEAERMEQEAMPTGLFAKLKYYLKRYAYIAIPVHMTCCTLWAIVIYLVVKSGVDNTPPSAGVWVVTFLLYKIATPVRYAFSLVAIRYTFKLLRKLGLLRTHLQLRNTVRSQLENAIRKLNQRRAKFAAKNDARNRK
uniref:DUF1279 domain-containing protein n=1 Tax=Ditylenchus dipsaci TaxID=166011 RepID=A0A915CMQ9_9BILA